MAPQLSSTTDSEEDRRDILNGREESSSSITPCWQVFPAHQWETLRERYGPNGVKLVHFVRHAEGTHNVEQDYKSENQLDARLTEMGYAQCQALATRILHDDTFLPLRQPQQNEDNITRTTTCVLTSPLTRCVQTAWHSFPHFWPEDTPAVLVPIVAHEAWRETVNYQCDRRRPLDEIRQEFPSVEFSALDEDNEDMIWEAYRKRLGDDWDCHMESSELYRVAERGMEGLQDLERRAESQIVVCTHSAFLRCLLNWGQEGGVPKLMPQDLDDRSSEATARLSHKIFDYGEHKVTTITPPHGEGGEEQALLQQASFEDYMRRDFENCELRSFCLLVRSSEAKVG